MPKITIKALQAALDGSHKLREGDVKRLEWLTTEINRLREQVKALDNDKQWLKQMHSAVLQATAELFRNRN